ncbi:MAG: bifunctional demethylmenaquinone methyltransferase/2-methoxy-6-polyprenyl-1,4-benzoquinol methylase UbiE [Candidatus Omnitrophica bacterium]|nr:bifunctional demethylmenaquinone methyltransferase/2-methoxy-6-polyprenyl-1,4-benzoquinol methylase UbiE [Candidatus Omnitrophota bacterium]
MLIDKSKSYRLFDRIAPRYDFINQIISLGLSRGWRKKLTDLLPNAPGLIVLDLATGTGEVPLMLLRQKSKVQKIIALDRSYPMLSLGKTKIDQQHRPGRVAFLQGDANVLPFNNQVFDAATLCFGIRNVPDPAAVLRELRRVLKPGGQILIMEFSFPPSGIKQKILGFILRFFIPIVGGFLSRDPQAYHYLRKSILNFPSGMAFADMLKQVGFLEVSFQTCQFGFITIYRGNKR